MGSYLFKFFWIILYSQYLLQCITYCLLRYYKEEAQLAELFFKKDVLEFVVKILLKYTNNEFLKIPFQNWTSSSIFFKDFDHNYYNNSSKYVANRTLFFKTSVTVSTRSEKVMYSHFLKKFLKETIHFSGCWLFLKKWSNESVVINITPSI